MDDAKTKRRVRIGVVQVASQPGQIAANQQRALPLIEQAAARGVELVALPELFACGYVPNRSVWAYAEPLAGPTVDWLRATSRRLGIHLGAGLAELAGKDVYNSWVVAGPQGDLVGCARKTRAETYCFRYGRGQHLVDASLGRLGVGICADNHFVSFVSHMQESAIDLMLMPHASPVPFRTSKVITEADVASAHERTVSLAPLWANLLGVPVVFANAVGPLRPMMGLLGRFVTPDAFHLGGLSRIVDSDGTLVAELGAEEGVIVGDVTLDPLRKQSVAPPDHDGWLHPGSAMTRKVIIPLDIALGRASYALGRHRARPQPLSRPLTEE